LYQQQEQQEEQQDDENPFLDPTFSRLKSCFFLRPGAHCKHCICTVGFDKKITLPNAHHKA
jgi:hypothetical protein